jgi:predicted N-acetyltransferase YhbS
MEMIEFRSLQQGELEAWFEHCAYVFSGGVSDPILKGLFINHFYMDPERNLEGILVAVENDQIISTVRIFYRYAYFFGKEMRVGGIGEVSTRPEHQGKGLAYRLLEVAKKQMRDRKVDISMLRGTAGIYSKLGWRKTSTYRQVSKVVAKNELPYRLRPAILDFEAPLLKAIHREYSKRFNGAFVRDDEYYWRFWVKMEGRNIWVIEDDHDKIIGYVSFQYNNGCMDLSEFCALGPYEDIFDQVVYKICFKLDREDVEVTFESLIRSGMKAESFDKSECNMFMLVNPITIDDEVIDSTEKLMDKLTDNDSENHMSDILFWGIDSF